MTQFLAKAQGMPRPIKDALVKMIRALKETGGHQPPEHPCSEQSDQPYLAESIPRPHSIAPHLGLCHLCHCKPYPPRRSPRLLPIELPTHIVVPEPTRGPRARTLPTCVLSLIKTAKEADLTFAPLKLSHHLKLQLPA